MYVHVHQCLCSSIQLLYTVFSSTGAAQESWLSGGQFSEKNIPEKWSKKDNNENKKFLSKQSIVIEECLKLLDQITVGGAGGSGGGIGGGGGGSRVSTTDTRASRLTIQLAVVYRELGRSDQAKSLLNNLLFRLKIKQEHVQDDRKYATYPTLPCRTLSCRSSFFIFLHYFYVINISVDSSHGVFYYRIFNQTI